ncbi:MAG: hypothetical protein IIC67_07300, partial [Thaumarchaeota archaeon]|nr:hypothetical protein [Nitrososphaerota archaeon]
AAPHEDSVTDDDALITFADSTTFTGPSGWDGVLELPTTTSVTIPTSTSTSGSTTTTTSFSEIAVFEIGVSGQSLSVSPSAKIGFINSGGQ